LRPPALARVAAANLSEPPVRLIVPYGLAAGLILRAIESGSGLSERSAKQFVNRKSPRRRSNLAPRPVVRAARMVITLALIGASGRDQCDALSESQQLQFIRDIAPIGMIVSSEHHGGDAVGSRPHRAEFITFAKANPDKLNMFSRQRSTPHVAGDCSR